MYRNIKILKNMKPFGKGEMKRRDVMTKRGKRG
jgi:hypothetical protein